jgi:hypothetical protein
MSLQIRSMKPEEIDLALDWAAAEGWNPGLQDAAPEDFLIGRIDATPVSALMGCRRNRTTTDARASSSPTGMCAIRATAWRVKCRPIPS